MKDEKHKILFALEGDALIVANTGAPFSRESVVSVCSMDLSNKSADGSYTPKDPHEDVDDNEFVNAILSECLGTYRGSPKRLMEDANREASVARSYGGRFVWELLQNADDAAGAERENARLIGAKGLGFKSVLEITAAPEIYSGAFDFHFSYAESQEKVRALNLFSAWQEGQGIPVCRLPHPKKRDEKVRAFFDEGYVTVIRLPLIAEEEDAVKQKLGGFCASALLFCQRLNEVEIRLDGNSRCIKVHRQPPSAHAGAETKTVELVDNGKCECWQIWHKEEGVDGGKCISVSVGLRVVNGEVQPCEEIPPLHVFFPTTERLHRVRVLIHASCEVEDNRKRLADDQRHGEKICGMLGSMTKRILLEIPPNAALRAFGKAKFNIDDVTMAAQLEKSIAEAVLETAFVPVIGGDRVNPGDVRLWGHGLGDAVDPAKVQGENLCAPAPDVDDASVGILHDDLDAKYMTDPEHARFLRFCKNATADKCLDAWCVAQAIMQSANTADEEECVNGLRDAPFWWIRGGPARAITDGPLSKKKPENCPDWLPVDIVDHDFLLLIKEEENERAQNADWENALSGKVAPLASKQEYFDHILMPYCSEKPLDWWQKNGWKIIQMALEWGKFGDAEPLIIGSDDDKERRAKIMYLPVGEGVEIWAPAWQCYAGVKWGGSKMLDHYFAGIPDRFVLSPYDDWHHSAKFAANAERWESLLRWLGCSWAPKMVQQAMIHQNRPVSDFPVYTHWEKEFFFEHFEEMLSASAAYKRSDRQTLLTMALEMHGGFSKKHDASYVCRSKRYAYPHACKSYARIQLENTMWVPCKPSVLESKQCVSPNRAYLPGFALNGLLPEVDNGGLDEQSWEKVRQMLVMLNANKSIPSDEHKLVGYMQKLSEYANRNGGDFPWEWGMGKKKHVVARAAIAIFDVYEKIESPSALRESVMMPCLRRDHKGERIYFEETKNVRWADQRYLAVPEVRRKILENPELHVFFRFLDGGKKLGLKPLSEYLDMQPKYGSPLLEESVLMRKRYNERRIGLEKATAANLPRQVLVAAFDNITLWSRKFPLSVEIKFWRKENGKVYVNAGRNNDMWQGLAMALGEVSQCPVLDVECLLNKSEWDHFVAHLRDYYGLSEESLEEVQEYVPAEPVSDVISPPEPGPDYGAAKPALATIPSQMHSAPTSQTSAHHPGGGRAQPAQSPPNQKLKVMDYVWPSKESAASVGGQRGGEQEAKADAGGEGEDLLAQHLSDEFGGANVKNMNEQIRNHPGYDILVEVNGEKFYYECKSFAANVPPRSVTLTEAQFKKAEEEGEHYRLCVIYDRAGDPKMLRPFCAPATLKNEPSRYRVYLPGGDRGPQSDETSS